MMWFFLSLIWLAVVIWAPIWLKVIAWILLMWQIAASSKAALLNRKIRKDHEKRFPGETLVIMDGVFQRREKSPMFELPSRANLDRKAREEKMRSARHATAVEEMAVELRQRGIRAPAILRADIMILALLAALAIAMWVSST